MYDIPYVSWFIAARRAHGRQQTALAAAKQAHARVT